ncbi:X-ray repair cross-complementing protein 5-like isoform X2 [Antedon mediterranea]
MDQAPANHESSLDTARTAVSTLLQRKVFAESKDEVALILFGTNETANHMEENGYSNIKQVRPMGPADFNLVDYVENEIVPGNQSADFIDALVVGLDLLHNTTTEKKFASTRILMFSDLAAPFSDDKIDSLINGIQKMKTDVNLIGPNLDDDWQNGDENQPSTSRGRGGSGDVNRKQKTPQQRAGAALMKHFLQQIDGGSYEFSDIIPMLSYFEKRTVKPMAWKCKLNIGDNLDIACAGYLKCQESKLKKSWGMTYIKGKGKEYKPQRVSSHHLNNDEETEIEKEDIVDAYRYGSDLIPMSKEDKESMAYKSPGKCLQTLGFTKEENIKEHMRMGKGVYQFIAEPGDQHAAVAFSAIVNALYETKSVIIVRRCSTARSMPTIGYLAPQIKANYECLCFTELPYAEDLKQYTFPSLSSNKKIQPTDEQLEAMDNLITSMDLIEEEGDEKEELFKSQKILNPYLQRIFQCLQHRALHENDPLPEPSHIINQTLQPNGAVEARCASELDRVKQVFKFENIEKDKTIETGSSLWKSNDVNDNGEPAAKVAKSDDAGDFSMASIAKGAVTKVGTVDPVKDFKTIIAQNKGKEFEKVCDEMIKQINELLKQSFGKNIYGKVMDCIKALRQECCIFDHSNIFNGFLKDLKITLPTLLKGDFWQEIQKAGVTLIASSECSTSSVTKDAAIQFLQEQKQENDDQTAVAPEEDEDDLLDMM